jgi:hypothetical protein
MLSTTQFTIKLTLRLATTDLTSSRAMEMGKFHGGEPEFCAAGHAQTTLRTAADGRDGERAGQNGGNNVTRA